MNKTPAQLRLHAERYETRAKRLMQEAAKCRRLATACQGLAATFREEAARVEREGAKVNTPMVQAHKMAISEGRNEKDPFLKAIRAAKQKYVLRDLAVALDIAVSTLSAHRVPRGRESSRPIPESRAKRVQTLTGWPADDAHWPAGIAKGK